MPESCSSSRRRLFSAPHPPARAVPASPGCWSWQDTAGLWRCPQRRRGAELSAGCFLSSCLSSLSGLQARSSPARAGFLFPEFEERSPKSAPASPRLGWEEPGGGGCCSQPLRRGAVPRPAGHAGRLAWFPPAGFLLCCRPPWDSSRLPFSGPSGSGVMLSGARRRAAPPAPQLSRRCCLPPGASQPSAAPRGARPPHVAGAQLTMFN